MLAERLHPSDLGPQHPRRILRELRRSSPTAHAGVVVDGDAVPQGEIDAHRDGCIVAKGVTAPGRQAGAVGYDRARPSGRCGRVRKRASARRLPDPPVELERSDADTSGCPRRQLEHVLIVEFSPDRHAA
jgi:hypothetical protein